MSTNIERKLVNPYNDNAIKYFRNTPAEGVKASKENIPKKVEDIIDTLDSAKDRNFSDIGLTAPKDSELHSEDKYFWVNELRTWCKYTINSYNITEQDIANSFIDPNCLQTIQLNIWNGFEWSPINPTDFSITSKTIKKTWKTIVDKVFYKDANLNTDKLIIINRGEEPLNGMYETVSEDIKTLLNGIINDSVERPLTSFIALRLQEHAKYSLYTKTGKISRYKRQPNVSDGSRYFKKMYIPPFVAVHSAEIMFNSKENLDTYNTDNPDVATSLDYFYFVPFTCFLQWVYNLEFNISSGTPDNTMKSFEIRKNFVWNWLYNKTLVKNEDHEAIHLYSSSCILSPTQLFHAAFGDSRYLSSDEVGGNGYVNRMAVLLRGDGKYLDGGIDSGVLDAYPSYIDTDLMWPVPERFNLNNDNLLSGEVYNYYYNHYTFLLNTMINYSKFFNSDTMDSGTFMQFADANLSHIMYRKKLLAFNMFKEFNKGDLLIIKYDDAIDWYLSRFKTLHNLLAFDFESFSSYFKGENDKNASFYDSDGNREDDRLVKAEEYYKANGYLPIHAEYYNNKDSMERALGIGYEQDLSMTVKCKKFVNKKYMFDFTGEYQNPNRISELSFSTVDDKRNDSEKVIAALMELEKQDIHPYDSFLVSNTLAYDNRFTNSRRNVTTIGNPAVYRSSTGEIILSICMNYRTIGPALSVEDKDNKDNEDYINDLCMQFFGKGDDKSIDNDWLNISTATINDSPSAIKKSNESMLEAADEVAEATKEIESKSISIKTNRINPNGQTASIDNTLIRW